MDSMLPCAKFPDWKNDEKQTIKAFFIDCYGTCVDVSTDNTPIGHAVWRVLSNFISYHGTNWTSEELCDRFFYFKTEEKERCRLLAGDEPFDIEERNVFRNMMPKADDNAVQVAGEIFRAVTAHDLRVYPGAREFFKAMRESGRKICLMSNAQSIYTRPELNALNIAGEFDEIGISSDLMYKKPSPEFFKIMVEKLGLLPYEVLMIGNHPGDDIEIPHQMGIRTCYLNSNRSPINAPPAVSDIYDIYLDYPTEKDVPAEHFPFFRLKNFFTHD